jgi:mRNA-degrading endonuclease YafQ of YafQ-DinJ toxin-antitoxin module
MKVKVSKQVIKKLRKSDKFVKRNFLKALARLKKGFPFERQRNVHKLK